MVATDWVRITNGTVTKNNSSVTSLMGSTPEELYRQLNCSYPKFFKMDKLCKWAFVAAECLYSGNGQLYSSFDKNKVSLALFTSHGCLDVDKKYQDSIDMPSPALFVYTLPNIMLGELCIRHGFKGEQVCMVSEQFNAGELHFVTSSFLAGGMDACLAGWVDVSRENHDVFLVWIRKDNKGLALTPLILQQLYGQTKA